MKPYALVLLFFALKLALHVLAATTLGIHRDELLYLALGRHLDWGYWSNPPFIGAAGWVVQHVLGDGLWAVRLLPAVAGAALVGFTLLMVRELGGGRWAQVICGTALLGSLAWQRAFSMLQPVAFDLLFWTLLAWALLRWLNTRQMRWWWVFGVVAGLGLLNKYTVGLWGVLLPAALLLTPERRALGTREPWLAAGVALLLLAPNLVWQYRHDFPVFTHLDALNRTQLAYVDPFDFLANQLLFHGPGVFVWLPGVLALLAAPTLRPYRVLGWFYLLMLALLLLMRGKDYYTLGAYPVLFAAGAVWIERTARLTWMKAVYALLVAALALPLLPAGMPVLPRQQLRDYFQYVAYDLGIDALVRWEQGQRRALPQDYADMLGWTEIAALVDTAVASAGAPLEQIMIYGENYGQAGAIEYYARPVNPPPVASFSDSYRLWAPRTLPADMQTLVYVNDELGEDVQDLFADIRLVGSVRDTLAREYGTRVYLCRQPRRDLPAFWAERVGR